jgi:hypothetical protein
MTGAAARWRRLGQAAVTPQPQASRPLPAAVLGGGGSGDRQPVFAPLVALLGLVLIAAGSIWVSRWWASRTPLRTPRGLSPAARAGPERRHAFVRRPPRHSHDHDAAPDKTATIVGASP